MSVDIPRGCDYTPGRLASALPNLDPSLERLGKGRYLTRDGHFHVYQGADRRWRIRGTSTAAIVVKMAARADVTFRTRDEAMGVLRGSIYAEPHGWAHHVEDAYEWDKQRVWER
jgi:hypothetical protein